MDVIDTITRRIRDPEWSGFADDFEACPGEPNVRVVRLPWCGLTAMRYVIDEQSLTNIAHNKLIVLDADGNPSGAYPFTTEEREHKVHVNGVTAHCMCALDALAVSPMFGVPTVIDSQCRVSGEKIHLEQNGTESSRGTLDVWFGINWGAASTDTVCAESLCMEMMFLANESVAREWLAESPETHEIFDLQSSVEFAAGFSVPLAETCKQAA